MVEEKTATEYRNFDVERAQIAQNLAELKDKSTKGTIDEPIRPFLDLINAQPDWISTSTCSGRLVSYLPGASAPDADSQQELSEQSRPAVNGKGGGNWLFVSHSTLEESQLTAPIQTLFGASYDVQGPANANVWNPSDPSSVVVHFVYQPPVFHLLARSVAVAVPLLTSAIGAGFRNSGITVGHRGRVILAIRASTGGLDVPIAIKKTGQPSSSSSSTGEAQHIKGMLELLVPPDYLTALLLQGNQLMQQNRAKLDRLFLALVTAFCGPASRPLPPQWESAEDRRRRMRAEGLAARDASSTAHASPSEGPEEDDEIPLSLLE
ncbi:hypothetical protein PCANC_19555 [Puccinia coronata f. sp. avenae]|uniref:tRNA wybutosine-synthesizing protein 3 n=1 Tax=Puccinia coronata f. sp. avenae TaxID=200324 RepID=A0A2N5UKW5_9BASI|nr:hypothetical protein PCANC_19555 [Puccinia coronata f. sp. avenae]PLW38418.1 hypothetical protein PCASD_10326 [Puccinia coronata f. sp. avenae]